MYTLITGASSAEAYALKNALNADNVLLGDYMELPEIMITSGKILKLPSPGVSSYAHLMLTLCLDKNIDTIYPLRMQEKKSLLNSQQLFLEYGISIIDNDKI